MKTSADYRDVASVAKDYLKKGYAITRGLLPSILAKELLDEFWGALRDGTAPFWHRQNPEIQERPTTELHSSVHVPLRALHWGMTGAASTLLGIELLPTYCMMRLYQHGDRLRVHADRLHCEHSATLPVGSSGGLPWPIEVGTVEAGPEESSSDFGDEPYSAIGLEPGQALFYRGPTRRHGRMTPNPNQWSVHLFLHWVEANGPHRHLAFSAD